MDTESLYDILGVQPDATPAQITTAYRSIVKSLHPDASGTAATSTLFRMVQHARDVLSDPIRRAAYDRSIAGGGPSSSSNANGSDTESTRTGPRSSSYAQDHTTTSGRVRTSSIKDAMSAFTLMRTALPTLSPASLADAVGSLNKLWRSGKVFIGISQHIETVLASNLRRDASRRGFTVYEVLFTGEPLALEVRAIFEGTEPTRLYRVWLGTGNSAALMGSAPDTIVSYSTATQEDPASRTGTSQSRPPESSSHGDATEQSNRTNESDRRSAKRFNLAVFAPLVIVGVIVAVVAILPSHAVTPPLPPDPVIARIALPALAPPEKTAKALAVAPDGQRVYVVESGYSGPGTLATVDTVANKTIASLPIGSNSGNIAISPDGLHLYITDGVEVSVVDTLSNSVVARIPTPGAGRIVLTPNGRLAYATVNDGLKDQFHTPGQVLVIDIRTNSVLRSISLNRPDGIAISTNGKAYVSDASGDLMNLDVIGPQNDSVEVVQRNLPRESEFAVAPDGSEAYLPSSNPDSYNNDGGVLTVNLANGATKPSATIPLTPDRVALSPDSRRALLPDFYTGYSRPSIALFDLGSERVVGQIFLNESEDVAWSPDGHRAYSISWQSTDVAVIAVP